MPGSCEVCSSEPSKYRCPICMVMSCSLVCTQAHKIYCAPKPQAPSEPAESSTPGHVERPMENGVFNHDSTACAEPQEKNLAPSSISASPEITELLRRHPLLRDQLHDMYRSTLEDEWIEWYTPPTRGRFNGRGGKAPSRRSRGPWTAEKGFNRGLGRVRKFRQDCEEGNETGAGAEAFLQFLNLVQNNQQDQPGQAGGSV
ncbi:hypothetical protein N7532_010754 [Penicillium argentinense]|uniref:HIT-type domain-containing protein n=1 Tax=Penicillium argentinense TaxID=1131581 RepID=A0A9W9EQ61_9EURO|nr:uncharacterized protein N7532_010754 [Penicillium argentinense]KAJ5085983.1 hypothetical protein N7532_010754 [Penicillium argentinense]